ncbi:response regulator transcription factor [Streptomyces sp. NBC_00588]|uniref:response regulator transcription factor n=1 Tax=Streptomyces sp. NBC_00588 TaxID=2975784 RepID=UPI002E81AB75|nr:response regulator [Streptomyces sp. NBC_00588]WUB38169.1 response regulator [Streptomyces sp. NBC_00588]
MTRLLADSRILIADDQEDVARTLCNPLRRAQARLHFVAHGEAALDLLSSHPFDLILVDMKMPPGEWGGLWLLQQLQAANFRTPILVLSGEGAKQQVIQAMRLGATDWVDKVDASHELVNRTTAILTDHHREALTVGSERLPLPVASRLARYIRTTDPDKQLNEGLRTLEAVLRFGAVIGIASTEPFILPGITIDRLAAPSMGTWLAICTALANNSTTSDYFKRLFSYLAPDPQGRKIVQEFIAIRNQIAHGDNVASSEDRGRLDALLRRFSHRANSYGIGELSVPTSMTYDGERYAVNVRVFRGTGNPTPASVSVSTPPVDGSVLLLNKDAEPLPLNPLMTSVTPESSDATKIFQFDGLRRVKGELGPISPLRLLPIQLGDGCHAEVAPNLTWPTIINWVN